MWSRGEFCECRPGEGRAVKPYIVVRTRHRVRHLHESCVRGVRFSEYSVVKCLTLRTYCIIAADEVNWSQLPVVTLLFIQSQYGSGVS